MDTWNTTFKITDEMVKKDILRVSFDAPGHGRHLGTIIIMVDFIMPG
jgi:hypothetical protein